MNPEWVAIYITLIGGVGTGFNMYLNLKMSGQIDKLKLWATDKFVDKDDMSTYLSPIKESIQMVGSQHRLRDTK